MAKHCNLERLKCQFEPVAATSNCYNSCISCVYLQMFEICSISLRVFLKLHNEIIHYMKNALKHYYMDSWNRFESNTFNFQFFWNQISILNTSFFWKILCRDDYLGLYAVLEAYYTPGRPISELLFLLRIVATLPGNFPMILAI